MFEQEVEMEKQQSSVVPLWMIVALILSIVGVAVYYVMQNRKVLATEEATTLVTSNLQAQGPVTIDFHVGSVATSIAQKPHDPDYRLLEKAGLLKIGKDTGRTTEVDLTPKGEALFKQIPGVTHSATPNEKSETWVVPIAGRKLVGTPKITMTSMGHATVEYSWAWDPNALGELFDAQSPQVQTFNTWERGTLIDKYNVKFYHAAPTKATIACALNDKGWEQTPQ
jgi:hypothetical protein